MWSELQAEVETWTWVDWGIVFFALWLAWHFFTELLSGIAKAIAQGAAEGRHEVEKERARERQRADGYERPMGTYLRDRQD